MDPNYTQIDILYCPSRWSKRLPGDVIIQRFIEKITQESNLVKETIACQLNIPYGPKSREKYDLFGTDLPEDSPLVFYIHGGYWQEPDMNRNNHSFIAKTLHKHNIKTICIGYELCPEVTVSYIIKSVKSAFLETLEYAKKYKSRSIHIIGHSAGAHLAATLYMDFITKLDKTEQKLIQNCIMICGIYDIRPLTETIFNAPLKLDENSATQASPMLQQMIADSGTKFYVVAAEQDSPVFVKQSEEFNAKLCKENINSEYVLMKGIDHFNIVEDLVEEDFEMTQKIISLIK